MIRPLAPCDHTPGSLIQVQPGILLSDIGHLTDPKGQAGAAKPQLQLIPPVLNTETAKALVLGAAKYGPWNWRKNRVELMTYLGAMKRHIDAVIDGEDIDPESGAFHLGHVAAGCGIVLDAQKNGTLIDNRP